MPGIVINITAGATAGQSSAHPSGNQTNIIADSERASFGIGSDRDLKRLVKRRFGEEPTDAYLKSPTPWGDLYKTYGWPQVQRVLRPVTCQIMEVNTKPTILCTTTLTNVSTKSGTFSTKLSEQVTDTISSTWSNNSKVSVTQMIEYKLKFLGTGAGGETTVGFEQDWGSSKTESQQTAVTTEHAVSVELKPKQSVIVELSGSRGTMRVRITYKAYLTGNVAVNYKHPYKGHHFWGLEISKLLEGSNSVEIVEDVEVGYTSNATVSMRDAKTNEKMKLFMADHPVEPPYDDDTHESLPADHPDQFPSKYLHNAGFK